MGDAVTGGPSGLSGIPALTVGGISFNTDLKFYYLAWAFALMALTLCLNLVRTPRGPGAWPPCPRTRRPRPVWGWTCAGTKCGSSCSPRCWPRLAGSLYAHYFGNVNPDAFSIFRVTGPGHHGGGGGMGSVWGTLFGVSFVVTLPYVLEPLEQYFDLIHGLILVLILMLLPQGLVSGLRDQARLYLARRRLAREAQAG